jgi:transcription initiation factor TFIID subunit 1
MMADVAAQPPSHHLKSSIPNGNMPHATEQNYDEDDRVIESLLNDTFQGGDVPQFNLDRPLELGEKADDAVDYEDIDLDDLPDDEDEVDANGGTAAHDMELDEIIAESKGTDLNGQDLDDDVFGDGNADDLFGDQLSSPVMSQKGNRDDTDNSLSFHDNHLSSFDTIADSRPISQNGIKLSEESLPDDIGYGGRQPTLLELQEALLPPPPESEQMLLEVVWPKFKRDTVLYFTDLLPPKKAQYVGKTPLKPPKPVLPTKISLDLAHDQERTFRLPGPATSNKRAFVSEAEEKGLVLIVEEPVGEESTDNELLWDEKMDEEEIGGVTFKDLEVLCKDWDSTIDPPLSDVEVDLDDEWMKEFGGPLTKVCSFVYHMSSLP